MKKIGIIMFFVGFISLMAGIYMSPYWIITGVTMVVLGGGVMGGSTYFFLGTKKNSQS